MSIRRRPRPFLTTATPVLVATLVAALVAGCGGGDEETTSSGSGGSTGTMVTVTENEFTISLSEQSFTPGTYTFVVKNEGKATHTIEIEGPGIEEKELDELDPGASGNLTVELQKGTYEIYCPVGNHKERGMETEITVA